MLFTLFGMSLFPVSLCPWTSKGFSALSFCFSKGLKQTDLGIDTIRVSEVIIIMLHIFSLTLHYYFVVVVVTYELTNASNSFSQITSKALPAE